MELKAIQVCRTQDGWWPIFIQSASDPDQMHLVSVSPWVSVKEFVCDCTGFYYRGGCRHQKLAMKKACWWSEARSPEKQTEQQRKSKVCPKCEGTTRWELIDEDAEDVS